jgi:antitoxin component YwqK of YwqJK toxin-antitoxin module
MKYIGILIILLSLAACSSNDDSNKNAKIEVLVEVKNGVFTEWYPGKKQIKFQGSQDDLGRRNGIWRFYGENGVELSFTEYQEGVKNGFTVVKYPTGVMHYRGEYKNDKTVGIWTVYDEKGKVATEKDYGYPAE